MPTTAAPALPIPPTTSPTKQPVQATQTDINIVLIMSNLVNRNMTFQEEESFIYELLEFFFLNSPDDVR